jgi:hypothetical protein
LEKAQIQAELTGTAQVVADAGKMDAALGKVGTTAGGKLAGAIKGVGGAIAGLASQAISAAGVLQALNLNAAVADAKALDLATAKLGQSAGIAGGSLKSAFDGMEQKTLTSSVAVAGLAKSLGMATHDAKFAAGAVGTLGEEALAFGRDIGDELPLAAALHDTGVKAGDLQGELGRLRDMAEQVNTIGGPTAFKDTLAALGPMLSGVNVEADGARTKLEALVAVLGKGLKPQQARAVGGAALSAIRSRAMDIERVTGRRVLDDNGNIVDPGKALADIKKLAQKRFGNNKEGMRRALMSDFGQDLGLAIMRTNFDEVDKVAAGAKDSGKTAKEAEAFRQSKEGQRIATGLAKDQAMRGVGEKIAGVNDALVGAVGAPGAMALELGGGQLALTGAKAVGGAGLKALSSGAGAASLGGAAMVAGGLAVAGGQVAALASLGEDRDTMGARYRGEHAQITGQGLANRAMREGDITGAFMATGGDKETQAAMLEALMAQFDKMNATLQGQANAFAEAMGKKPLKVTLPKDPNKQDQ